jgi:predicted RNA-binding Zn ribbon-like protein
MPYSGPLRDEPLAIELHNTIYATSGGAVDALADPSATEAWLEALTPRLHPGATAQAQHGENRPPGASAADESPGPDNAGAPRLARDGGLPDGAWPAATELIELRDVVRSALHAAVLGEPPSRAALDAINLASARAPRSPSAVWQAGTFPRHGTDFHDATRADVVLAAFAQDAIRLLAGPCREELRACGAPRCVLMFLRDHPRREWCSDSCGNRARQARHYERTRHGGGPE